MGLKNIAGRLPYCIVAECDLNRAKSLEDGVGLTGFLLPNFFDFHEDDGLGSADDDGSLSLALVALEPEGDFLGGLGLLSEDGLGLSSVTRLLAVVTSSSLGGLAFLALLVLSDLVDCVSLALRAVRVPGLRNHHHFMI